MRLQIAFDYLMVFIFVLLVFTILFSSIARQREAFFNQEIFGQLQTVAQTVSSEITAAEQAGNGYNATIPLPSELSLLQYNISVTKYGAVIVTTNNLGENVQAVATSVAYNLLSNSIYLSTNNQYYNLPTYLGSGFITIQNSYGTICIDYQCPSPSLAPLSLSLESQNTYGIRLNGNAHAMLSNTPTALNPSSVTLSAWVEAQGSQPGTMLGNNFGSVAGLLNSYNILVCGTTSLSVCYLDPSGSGTMHLSSPGTILKGKWYLLTAVMAGGKEQISVDGSNVLLSTITAASHPGNFIVGNYLNGTVANIQLYNTSLTSNEIDAIYGAGIRGSPITYSNLVGWWPLAGSTQDLGGHGYNLTLSGPSSYSSVSELTAQEVNGSGGYANDTLVGFTSTEGNFSQGASAYNFTNSSGVATAFLSQGGSQGLALVKATVSSSPPYSGNLVAWWPFNEGQGSLLNDISGQASGTSHLTGNILFASWASPNYVSGFDGSTAYVQIPNIAKTQPSSSNPITMTGWIDASGPSNGYWGWIFAKQGAFGAALCGSSMYVCYYDWGGTGEHDSSTQLSTNTWYMITTVVSSGTESVYVNGVPVIYGGAISFPSAANGLQFGYGGCCDQLFNGEESNMQMYGAALTQQQISSLYQEGIGGPPLPSSNLYGWWPLDGNANDYSGSGLNGTIYGNLQMNAYSLQQNPSYLLSAKFNGASSEVTINSIEPIETGNFTEAAWVYYQGTTSHCQGIFGNPSTIPSSSPGNSFQLDAGGGAGCSRLMSVNNKQLSWPSSTYNFPSNTWLFVTATYGSAGTATVYVNGAEFASGSLGTKLGIATAGPYNIGNDPWSAGVDSFNGRIADVQLYNTTLSQQQVLQLYSHGMSSYPLAGAGAVAWYPLNGDTNDYMQGANQSSNGNAVNVNYAASGLNLPYSSPSLSGTGLYFNGANSNVVVANSVNYNGEVTVSAYIYPASFSNAAHGMSIVGQSGSYALTVNSLGGYQAGFSAVIGGTTQQISTTYPLTVGSWYMLTGVYNATSLNLFVDGVEANTLPDAESFSSSQLPTVIGSSATNPYTGNYFNGTIADVQIYNAGLSSQQIAELYSAGLPLSSSTVVPVGALP